MLSTMANIAQEVVPYRAMDLERLTLTFSSYSILK